MTAHGMRYLTSDTSQLMGAAALTATNVVASSTFEYSRDADGGGNVTATGSYTGAADAVYTVEITSTTIPGDPQLSAPVFRGVGNGTLTGLTATGIAAQQFVVTLEDLGTETRAAWVPFHAATLQALTTGTAGNTYTLSVDQSGLTATATDYSVQRALSEGVDTYTGAAYDFGGPVLEPDGSVPESAPRLRFGDDSVVYRHWKEYRAGGYRYRFSPPLVRDVPVGTPVYTITGGRSVALYDGATLLDTYTSVTSLYSLLTQIRDGSDIEYTGAIAADRSPGGMGCDDLTLQTASYVAGSTREGTVYMQRATVPLTVAAGAPSETLTLTCLAAPIPGAEIWEVRGAISGRLDDAYTGDAYADGDYAFTIPRQLQPGQIPPGDKSAYLELLTRSAQETTPVLCIKDFVLGAEAGQESFEFVWTPRPADDCDCTGTSVTGYLDPALLGIDPPQGGTTVAESIPAALQSRVETLNDWRAAFVNANTAFLSTTGAQLMQVSIAENSDDAGMYWSYANGFAQQTAAILKADRGDIRLAEAVYQLFESHLFLIYAAKGNTLPAAAATEFDTQWTGMDAFLLPLETNEGSDGWETAVFSKYQAFIKAPASGTAKSELAEAAGMALARQLAESRNITTDPAPVLARARAAITKIYGKAGLRSPFDVSTLTGNSVWSDGGGSHWFVSSNGLLPLQPGRAYYSCSLQDDGTGVLVPTADKRFYIALAVGCESSLKPGDKLIIKTGAYANARATYQAGDSISWEIIRADPLAFGGGQVGDDTLTFSVRGSVAGALADYALDTTAPAGYSDGGLGFSITPGGIPFAAGDQWTFSAEGGVFRWRKNAGSWNTGVAIEDSVLLSDGVSAVFSTGASPSWQVGDTYTITARAINGVAHLITPDDGALSWTSNTQIDWTPSNGALAVLMIAAHTIPAGATITLSASDDNWSTTAYSATIPRVAGEIVHLIQERTHQKWRLAITGGSGSIGWLYAGTGTQPMLENGITEPGEWRRAVRIANAQRGRAVAGDITHEGVTYASAMAVIGAIEYAAQNDDGRLGVVSPAGYGAFARVDADEIVMPDLSGYQSSAPLISFTVPLQAA